MYCVWQVVKTATIISNNPVYLHRIPHRLLVGPSCEVGNRPPTCHRGFSGSVPGHYSGIYSEQVILGQIYSEQAILGQIYSEQEILGQIYSEQEILGHIIANR